MKKLKLDMRMDSLTYNNKFKELVSYLNYVQCIILELMLAGAFCDGVIHPTYGIVKQHLDYLKDLTLTICYEQVHNR